MVDTLYERVTSAIFGQKKTLTIVSVKEGNYPEPRLLIFRIWYKKPIAFIGYDAKRQVAIRLSDGQREYELTLTEKDGGGNGAFSRNDIGTLAEICANHTALTTRLKPNDPETLRQFLITYQKE